MSSDETPTVAIAQSAEDWARRSKKTPTRDDLTGEVPTVPVGDDADYWASLAR